MAHWETIWRFRTARFCVSLDCTPEDSPDVSWADAETLEHLESGEYRNVTFRVRVMCDGLELGNDYLGNSIYHDVRDFYKEHLGIRASGHGSDCYFTDMVHQAITEARTALRNLPPMRET